ncbi:MAG: J domain-containing protein [Synechococcales bacterium]|nr:J domain-containing protein [Synechococcales bacterium]
MRFDIKLGKAYANVNRPQISEIISEINHRIHQPSYTWHGAIASVLVAIALGLVSTWWLGFMVLGTGAVGTWWMERQSQQQRGVFLNYHIDRDIQLRFSAIQTACQTLAKSEKIWLEAARKPVKDLQKNAGASHVINLSNTVVRISCAQPPFIRTNLSVWSIDVGYLTLFFLPDYILVWRRQLYTAISYSALQVRCDRQQINMVNNIPSDAHIIGQTWQHVTPAGTPDPKVGNNPRLYQVQYGLLRLVASIGFSLRLHVSNVLLAEQFTKTVVSVQQWLSPRQREDAEPSYARRSNGRSPEHLSEEPVSAYEVLGITPGASLNEIRAAYHRVARQNHPDKVVGLAPEFRTLAEQRMKVITAAYKSLSQEARARR